MALAALDRLVKQGDSDQDRLARLLELMQMVLNPKPSNLNPKP